MTDNLERLRAVDHMSVEDCFLLSPLFEKAADKITSLTSDLREIETQNIRLQAEVKRLEKIVRGVTPKQIRYAPKAREIIGAERPYDEDKTYFYGVIWNEDKQHFLTSERGAFCGVTHFIDPDKLPGIIWPRERAALQENSNER